jgi:zinc transport system ATP-binding protein
MPVIDVDDGAVVLGGRPVLRGIDLSVREGDVVALLGANGSGKSTLVRSVLGLTPLHRGEVRLFGTSLGRFDEWRRIGYVPQRVTATAGVPASVQEVVAAGRLSHRSPLRRASRADRSAVRHAIETVGLSDRRRDGVATLSGGQQQRVLMARALAGDPDLLVLDEPLAGVDLASQETFAQVVKSWRSRGRTVLVVLHETGPLVDLITRTVVLRDGRVVYDGAPVESFEEASHEHAHAHGQSRLHVDYRPDVRTPVDRATNTEEGAS